MHTLHYVIVKYRYRLQDRNAHLIVPMRAGGQLTAHPRSPEMSIPLATVTSARNTVRLQPGLGFTVTSITKTNIILTSEASAGSAFRVASQAFRDDDDLPTILTSEPAGLGIVTSGLVRIGMTAEVINSQNGMGDKLMALRIGLITPTVSDSAIVFENIPDGNITLRQDGKPDKVLGKVVRSASGTGRIDGTEGIGAGSLAGISRKSLIVSSSPDTAPPPSRFAERRGGIEITTTLDAQPSSLVIKAELNQSILAGFGFAGKSHIADVQRENGDWERFPSVVGHRADTFVHPHPKGQVIAVRIRPSTGTSIAQSIQAAALQCEKASLAEAKQRKLPIISGMHTLRISPTDPGRVASLKIRIADLLFVMNVKPFFKTWDTTSLPDGLHSVIVELLDDTGALITTTRQEVYVKNRNLATELSSCQW